MPSSRGFSQGEIKPGTLEQLFSKCGPGTSSVSLSWKLVRNEILRPHPRLTESKTLGGGGAFQGILLYSQV